MEKRKVQNSGILTQSMPAPVHDPRQCLPSPQGSQGREITLELHSDQKLMPGQENAAYCPKSTMLGREDSTLGRQTATPGQKTTACWPGRPPCRAYAEAGRSEAKSPAGVFGNMITICLENHRHMQHSILVLSRFDFSSGSGESASQGQPG
eukprot:g38316.t1